MKPTLRATDFPTQNGHDVPARETVALASFLAGYAFNKSGLGYVHAISHQISAHYNTPHGLANAVILPRVLRFNRSACADRLADLERVVSGSTKHAVDQEMADQFIARVDALSQQVGIPVGLSDLDKHDFNAITTSALKEARTLYPVPQLMSAAQCEAILQDNAVGD